MNSKSQTPTFACNNQLQKIVQISATNLSLIKEKIGQLGKFDHKEESNCNQSEKSKQTKYRDLIPFIMMYIFLNYDCLTSSSSSKIRLNMKKEARKESDLKKMILKTAKDCAKFCENKSNQEEERKFSEQCLKKVKKNLKLKAKPNQEEIDSIQKKIDVFDKMFYVKTDDYDQISSEDVLCDGNQINDDEDLSESSEDEEKRNTSWGGAVPSSG